MSEFPVREQGMTEMEYIQKFGYRINEENGKLE
jgi:hypothetical protein